MLALMKGRYSARLATTQADVQASQRLRHACFFAQRGISKPEGLDEDPFDAISQHMMVEEAGSGALVCTYRLITLRSGADINLSYAAQFYDLERLRGFSGPMMELGRFCIAAGRTPDADLLRVAWGAMTRLVDDRGVELLFGCASFPNADATAHQDALQSLAAGHLGPARYMPGTRHPDTVAFAAQQHPFDRTRALMQTPALLRTYLMMGGWVSDHAVLDHALDTLHVFTAVEIAAIPPARARALRAVAA